MRNSDAETSAEEKKSENRCEWERVQFAKTITIVHSSPMMDIRESNVLVEIRHPLDSYLLGLHDNKGRRFIDPSVAMTMININEHY